MILKRFGAGMVVVLLLLWGHLGAAEAQVIACQQDTDCPLGAICKQQRCKDLVCIDIWQPVCGTDGHTYSSRCYARAAHVRVAYKGECRGTCGGGTGLVCPKSQFCELPIGKCDSALHKGVCVDYPRTCPYLWDPVCGCDGKTYANSCWSRHAGVSILMQGECKARDRVCTSNDDCGKNESCQFRAPSCGDGTGVCVVKPEGCTEEWAPECGCDGTTYANTCYRLRAGISLLHTGECKQSCGGVVGPVCPHGKICDLKPGSCDTPDAPGTCEPIPEICPDIWDPVCGCDSETYANDCERLKAGAAKDHHGACGGRQVGTALVSRDCYGDCLAVCRDLYLSCVDYCREEMPGDQECHDACDEDRDDCDQYCLEICG